MQTDGRTDMTKPVVPFSNFANAPRTNLRTKNARSQTRRGKSYAVSIRISLIFPQAF